MRVLLVSDAWLPQVNGVVTCLQALKAELQRQGHQVRLLVPDRFQHLPCPSYPEIRLSWNLWKVAPLIRDFRPDCIHIATEGPLGWAARRYCQRRGLAFTSAIHTRFPEYVSTRWPWVPLNWGYAWLRRFHAASDAVLVSSEHLRQEFAAQGFSRLALWSKGVDTRLFRPQPELPRPAREVFLYVGRLALEKGVEAFLALDLPGEQWLVGDGPQREELQRRYPQARFFGYQQGEALAALMAQASVLVFPSRTDTLGLVMLEALACGTPVAAFPVRGPLDVLEQGVTGVMDEDLRAACLAARLLPRERCARAARRWSWAVSAAQFLRQQSCIDGEPLPDDSGLEGLPAVRG